MICCPVEAVSFPHHFHLSSFTGPKIAPHLSKLQQTPLGRGYRHFYFFPPSDCFQPKLSIYIVSTRDWVTAQKRERDATTPATHSWIAQSVHHKNLSKRISTVSHKHHKSWTQISKWLRYNDVKRVITKISSSTNLDQLHNQLLGHDPGDTLKNTTFNWRYN